MRKYLLISILVITGSGAAAQKRQAAYLEVLGNGLILSANYDRQISKKTGLGWHAGIGLGGDKPVIPFGLNYLFILGKNKKSLLETGLGVTFMEKEMWDDAPRNGPRNPYQPGIIPSVSYRRHTTSGFMYRAGFTPVIHKTGSTPFFFGVSMGWQF